MMKANFNACAFPEALCPDCSTCQKPIGVFQCVGCGKVFCSQDTVGHRQMLRSELQEIIHESEQYNAYWNDEIQKRQRVLKTKQDNVMKQIEEWEAHSIAKIRQASAEAQEQTRKLFEHHTDVYPKCTSLDISSLKRAMETDGFLETHLEKWRRSLDCWKNRITSFVTDFIRVKTVEPFIPKLVIEGEYSTCASADPCAEQGSETFLSPVHLMVPVERNFTAHNENVLRTGIHQFRYRSKCVFSENSSKTTYQARNPCETPSTYGWTSNDRAYFNANPVLDYDGHRSHFELGDTYLLMVDCDRRVVRLTNERTNATHVLDIDPTKSPLPLQLYVRFLDNAHARLYREE